MPKTPRLGFGHLRRDEGIRATARRSVPATLGRFGLGRASRFFTAKVLNFAAGGSRITRENTCGAWLGSCKSARILRFKVLGVLQKSWGTDVIGPVVSYWRSAYHSSRAQCGTVYDEVDSPLACAVLFICIVASEQLSRSAAKC